MYRLPVRSGLSNNGIATLRKRFVYRQHVNVGMLNGDLEIYSFIERCTYRQISGSVCHKSLFEETSRIRVLDATVPQHLLGNENTDLYHPLKKISEACSLGYFRCESQRFAKHIYIVLLFLRLQYWRQERKRQAV